MKTIFSKMFFYWNRKLNRKNKFNKLNKLISSFVYFLFLKFIFSYSLVNVDTTRETYGYMDTNILYKYKDSTNRKEEYKRKF